MTKIRVLLADDHPLVRQGLRTLIEQASDLLVVAEAENGVQALALVQQTQPDVVILDIELPQLSGLEVARQLKERQDPVRVLVLSAYDDAVYVRHVLHSGVAGYLTKAEAPAHIVEVIRHVARGESDWFSQRVAAQLSRWVRERTEKTAFSDRQRAVLHLVVQGKTNQQIGHCLQISEKTVEKHVHTLFRKAGLTSRVELAVWAVHQGLVEREAA